MDRLGYRLMGAAVGFLIGCLVIAALYYFLHFIMDIFSINYARFRVPVGVLILPFIALFFGFKFGMEIFSSIQRALGDSGPLTRLLLAGPVFWALVVLTYVLMFEPFGYRISEDEWILVGKIILFPTGVVWCGAWVINKFVIQKQ